MTRAKRQLEAAAHIAQVKASIQRRRDSELAHARANYATNLKAVSLLAEHCRAVLEHGGSGDPTRIAEDLLLDVDELAGFVDDMGLLVDEDDTHDEQGAR